MIEKDEVRRDLETFGLEGKFSWSEDTVFDDILSYQKLLVKEIKTSRDPDVVENISNETNQVIRFINKYSSKTDYSEAYIDKLRNMAFIVKAMQKIVATSLGKIEEELFPEIEQVC